ncbi:hypothetical protein DY000_02023816 [Brassica cretica]|uniref:Uncharacterized protein n=1 Tax=Brassica cretica TaxID=69181 RepID=A0ABQ7EAQ9_BRACR|nr:hypothetical protein DY000_02023816 [Brassica cretica]
MDGSMKTSRWRLNDENIGQMNVDGVLLVSGRFEGNNEGDKVRRNGRIDGCNGAKLAGCITLSSFGRWMRWIDG